MLKKLFVHSRWYVLLALVQLGFISFAVGGWGYRFLPGKNSDLVPEVSIGLFALGLALMLSLIFKKESRSDWKIILLGLVVSFLGFISIPIPGL